MNILEELWLGHIAPIEDTASKNAEYIHTIHEITEQQKSLEAALPPNALSFLHSYNCAQVKLLDLSERSAFSQGFRLGAKLMLTIFEKDKK